MTHEENNKLIAEFMDVHVAPLGLRRNVLVKSFLLQELCYHTSWDWLMPVVEKIEGLGFEFEIKVDVAFLCPEGEAETPYIGHTGDSKIDAAYNLCLQFIQWYNTQNK